MSPAPELFSQEDARALVNHVVFEQINPKPSLSFEVSDNDTEQIEIPKNVQRVLSRNVERHKVQEGERVYHEKEKEEQEEIECNF